MEIWQEIIRGYRSCAWYRNPTFIIIIIIIVIIVVIDDDDDDVLLLFQK